MIRVLENDLYDDADVMQEYKVIWTFDDGHKGQATCYSQKQAEEEVAKRKEKLGDELKDITIKKGRKFVMKNGKMKYI